MRDRIVRSRVRSVEKVVRVLVGGGFGWLLQ